MVKKQVQAFIAHYLKPLSNLGIRKKIACGYILAIGIAAFGAISARVVHGSAEEAEEIAEEIAEKAELLKELELTLLEVHHLPYRLASLVNQPEDFNQKTNRLFRCIDSLEKILDRIQPCSDSIDEVCDYVHPATDKQLQQWLKDHRGTIGIYSQQIEVLLSNVELTDGDALQVDPLRQSLIQFANGDASQAFGHLSDELQPIFPVFDAAFNEAHQAYEESEALEGDILVISLLASTFLATVFAIITSRAIAHPLEVTTKIAQEVTKTSNFNLRAPVITQDEVGQLTLALNHLIQRVSEYTQALQTAKESAEAASRAKSEFLSKMSHEFRTPLNAILGFSQLMGGDLSLKPEHQEHLDTISRSGEHLLVLINDVLEMAKIEAGQISLNESNFDLHWLLKSLQEMLQIRAEVKGLQLIFDCSPGIPQYLRTDEGKLRQVLINLLGNAIKFTQAGRVTLRVRPGDKSQGKQERGAEGRGIKGDREMGRWGDGGDGGDG
ncbi:MAG: histidine kinase dimerization/phospho-acceptor domain-containing protein, partial [Leptolyngbyaceae cyanobacterium MO_188.B28]|nr:histidine kinase dimerization/phospho-acceptor domain-containing protein [Leptolyngbyaceae cyanobacterium MO_188.B28]